MIYPAAATNMDERQSNTKVLPYTTGVLPASAYNGTTTQNTKSICVSAINSRLGQRTNFKKAVNSFKRIVYRDFIWVSTCQLPRSFITFSITSRAHPSPPFKGEI
jgi:hypothetical protein